MTGEFERGGQRDHNHNEKYTIVLSTVISVIF